MTSQSKSLNYVKQNISTAAFFEILTYHLVITTWVKLNYKMYSFSFIQIVFAMCLVLRAWFCTSCVCALRVCMLRLCTLCVNVHPLCVLRVCTLRVLVLRVRSFCRKRACAMWFGNRVSCRVHAELEVAIIQHQTDVGEKARITDITVDKSSP